MTATATVADARTKRLTGREWLAAAALSTLAIGDLQIERYNWSAESLGPRSRMVVLFVVWAGALFVGWNGLRRTGFRATSTSFRFLIAFLLAALVSSVLGVTPVRSVAVWLGFAAIALCVWALVSRGHRYVVLAAIFIGSGTIALASVVGDQLGAELRIGGRLGGYSFEPNLLGQLSGLCLIVGAILVVSREMRPEWFLLVGAFAFYAAYESGTRTTWPALALAALAFEPRGRRLQTVATAAFVGLLVIGFVGLDALEAQAQRTPNEDLTTFTGRTDLWSFSVERIGEAPLIGHGIASGLDQFAPARTAGEVQVRSFSSHNIGLEILRETGIIGLALISAALAASRPARSAQVLPLLAFVLVSGLTMPTAGLPSLVFASWIAVVSWRSDERYPTSAPYP